MAHSNDLRALTGTGLDSPAGSVPAAHLSRLCVWYAAGVARLLSPDAYAQQLAGDIAYAEARMAELRDGYSLQRPQGRADYARHMHEAARLQAAIEGLCS